jgi:N-acyl-L-homoserine lactone synthetase
MTTTVTMGNRRELSLRVIAQMHALRRDAFAQRLGPPLPANEEERDEYDHADAKYLIVSEANERVTACTRFLPTTKRYMLAELFPHLLGTCPAPRHPAVWELSRFATDVRDMHDGRVVSLSKPTLELLDLVFIFVRPYGVKRLLLVTSIGVERLMLRANVHAHRLGPPAPLHGHLSVALSIEVPLPETKALSPKPVSLLPLAQPVPCNAGEPVQHRGVESFSDTAAWAPA